MKVIQFAEYIQFQLRCVTKQLINVHNLFLSTHSRINCIVCRCIQECWSQHDVFIVRELSMKFREMPPTIQALL